MNTPIFASIIFGDRVYVGFQFDVQSLEDLVISSINSVNRSLIYFARSKDKKKDGKHIKSKMSKRELTLEIGINMEILEKAVFLSIQDKDIKFSEEIRQSIKELFTKVSNLLYTLGQSDSDFCTDDATQRATPSKEMLEFIAKKW